MTTDHVILIVGAIGTATTLLSHMTKLFTVTRTALRSLARLLRWKKAPARRREGRARAPELVHRRSSRKPSQKNGARS